jgi:hypothetical protein
VTVKEPELEWPVPSLALQFTVLVPTAKVLPEGGSQVTAAGPVQ